MSEQSYTLEYISEYLGSDTVIGDKSATISALSGTSDIESGSIVCVSKKSDINFALDSKAACLVAKEADLPENKDLNGKSAIVVDDTTEAFAKLLALFFKEKEYAYGTIEPSAVVSASANISPKAYIAHNVVVGENTVIGDNTVILSNTVIGDNVVIKNGCRINASVVLHDNTILEDNVIIGSSSVIGGDGFGYYLKDGRHNKIPQKGNVIIGANVEIGSSVTIDRAVIGSTKIGSGTKIDNLVHIAHNCTIGENAIIIAQVGIAGSSSIGNWTTLAGQVGIADHAEIGDQVIIAAQSGIMNGVKVADKSILFGTPAQDMTKEKMAIIAYRKLPKVIDAVESLTGERIKSK